MSQLCSWLCSMCVERKHRRRGWRSAAACEEKPAADAAEGEAPALTTEQEFQVAANRCAAYYLLLSGRAGQEGALLLSGSRHSWPVRWNLYARDAV